MKIYLENEAATASLAGKIAASLKGGEVLALIGDLGAGKTTFTKALLSAAGVRNKVTSPTFVLMVPYAASGRTFYHLDLYRTDSFAEVKALGINQLWQLPENIFLIEWADKIIRHLPKKSIRMYFSMSGNGRNLEIVNAPRALLKMLE